MALESGTKLGSYEIIAALGAGGMGEVYRARDSKLRREVAIKVLPAGLVEDPERRSRFLNEARASAAVNHPNIATIHEVGEAGGVTFIAMELVEGETLRSLLRRGPLPIPAVLRLATEMAEGLAHAHQGRVIHRDLKPENVMVRPDGHPKILDFGLAKLIEQCDADQRSRVSLAETVTVAVTREGKILGTPAYMSPEQARGEAVDARSDLFTMGSILYEMIVGRAPFEGKSTVEVLGAILRDRPPRPSDSTEMVPPELDRIIGKCLEKSPEDRYQHTDELAVDLRKLRRDTESGQSGSGLSGGGIATTRKSAAAGLAERASLEPKRFLPIIVIALLAGGGIGWWLTKAGSPAIGDGPRPVRRFEIDIGRVLTLYDWSIPSEFALSPDGTRIAYVARTGENSQLYLRRLDEVQATLVPGTDHALSPFFSPDGRWVGYYSADSPGKVNELRKVPVDGGPPQVICKAWPPVGGTWLPDGTIVFASTEPFTDHPVWDGSVQWGLFRVDGNGGAPRILASVDRAAGGEAGYSRPRHLPGGRAVLFTIRRTGGAWAQPGGAGDEPDWATATADVALLDLASGDHRTLIENAHDATYSSSGHILFMRDQDLWAAPFDLGKLAVSGPERIVRQGLQSMRFPVLNSPYAIDDRGSAMFLPATTVPATEHSLVWVDRNGDRELAEVPPANRIETPRVSPDGERILYVVESTTGDIWVHERSRPGSRMRLTYDETDDRRPVWFPDSQQFLYMVRTPSERSPIGYYSQILRHRSDGAGRPSLLPRTFVDADLSIPMDILADQRTVLYQEGGGPDTLWDIADSSRPLSQRYIVQSPALEEDPAISSDERWLAYSALESGVRQIYVVPFPDTQSARWQITSDGGSQPLWAPDGSELYYRNGAAMMAVPIRTRPDFRAGSPVKLFDGDFINPDGPRRDYDLEYPEGKRFLMVEEREPDAPDTRFIFVENWDQELERLVPAGSR